MWVDDLIKDHFKDKLVDWDTVGRNVIKQLPKDEHQPFYNWVAGSERIADIYESSPGKALKLWQDSVERYSIVKETK